MTQATHSCADCVTDISHRPPRTRRCEPCAKKRAAGQTRTYDHGGKVSYPARACDPCGQEYVPKRFDSRSCSQRCNNTRLRRAESAEAHAPRPCPECGNLFMPARVDALCCSRPCYRRYRYSYTPVQREPRKCGFCKKTFTPTRSDAIFCSGKCSSRNYYRFHPEDQVVRSQRWLAANPDRRRVAAANYKNARREWEFGNPQSVGVSERDWQRTVRRFGGRCAYCGALPDPMHMDHVVPLSRTGRHAIGNVLPACEKCNLAKGSKLLVEWRYRYAGAPLLR